MNKNLANITIADLGSAQTQKFEQKVLTPGDLF